MAFNLEELNKLRKKNIKQYVMVKRNKEIVIILGVFLIINMIIINTFLKPFNREVVDTSKFTEFYQSESEDKKDLEDVFVVLSKNYYTIKKNYNLKDKPVEITEEQVSKILGEEIKEPEIKPETTTAPKVALEKRIYEVKAGDSLDKISKEFSQSINIIKANNPKIGTTLQIGEELLIPTINGIYYRVKNGDSLSRISTKYKVKIDVIKEYNNLTSDTLKVGQELFLKDPNLKNISSSVRTFTMPVNYKGITSPYGNRFHPVLKRYILHSGVDMVARYVPVTASRSGVVTFVGVAGGYGKLIKIKHSDGYETRYAHLNRIDVKKGQKVSQGQSLGQSGMTGRVTGPHLHFEVRKNGKPVNPMKYLKR